MTTPFTPAGLPVLIGSLPLDDHAEALDMILEANPEIPLWPQLPGNPLEQMLPQFTEGIPCICEENSSIYFDSSDPAFAEQMLAFYEDYMAVQDQPELLLSSRFQVSRERAEGLYQFAARLATQEPVAVKGQLTGPFTMLTGIKDRQGRAGYYDETVREMLIKGMAMKAAWQTQFLRKHSKGKQVIVFIDEPALAGLGSSAFISVDTTDIQEMINEVAGAIQGAGGLAGIHVCANTQWDILLDSQVDILSFDAYSFFDKLAAFTEPLHRYLDRGSILAWGGIPTGQARDIEKESVQSLSLLWEQQHKKLLRGERDAAALLRQSLISPSCGTGSLSREHAAQVLHLTKAVSEALRAKYL